MRPLSLLFGLLLVPILAAGQPVETLSYGQIERQHPNAPRTALTSSVNVYDRPSTASDQVTTLSRGDSLLVYEVARVRNSPLRMFGVARRGNGHLGYIRPHFVPESVRQHFRNAEATIMEAPKVTRKRPPDTRQTRFRKDPTLATLISIPIIGGGHLYAGDTRTGVFLLGSSAIASTISVSYYVQQGTQQGEETITTFAGLYVLGAWIYGIVDAGDAAREANRRSNLRMGYSGLHRGPKISVTVQF